MASRFVLHISSYREYGLEVIAPILQCGVLSLITFPAHLLPDMPNGQPRVVEKSTDFRIEMLDEDEQDMSGDLNWIRLVNVNFLETECLFLQPSEFFPSIIINQTFNSETLEKGTASLQTLQKTIIDMMNVVDISDVHVWDRDMVDYPELTFRNYRVNGKDYTTQIGWLSYFGAELVAGLGRERFDRLVTCHQKYEVNGGMMVILTEEPYDAHNPAHRERELQAIRELGLEERIPPLRTFPALLKKRKQE